jgi:hypothetical protein
MSLLFRSRSAGLLPRAWRPASLKAGATPVAAPKTEKLGKINQPCHSERSQESNSLAYNKASDASRSLP